MKSATTSPPRRGRPREFDRDVVLEKVMALFWEKGFEATSVSDIVETTALNKSSLYNAFGSKEELFSLALERYLERRTGMITEFLVSGARGLADIASFLELLRDESQGTGGRYGCLAINTSTELGTRNDGVIQMSLDFRDEIRTALRAVLTRAEAAGEIDAGSVDRHTAILLSFLLSLPVMTRSGASADELDGQFAAAQAMIDDWRVTEPSR